MEVSSSRVVAESLPLFYNGLFAGGCQSSEIGEDLEPIVEVGQNRFHLSLLEHELGNHRLVEAWSRAPR